MKKYAYNGMKGLQNRELNIPPCAGTWSPPGLQGKIIFSDIFFQGIHMHSCIEDFSFLYHTKNRHIRHVAVLHFSYLSKKVKAYPIEEPRPVRPMRWI